MSNARPVIVLVHGAWHGAWCWQRVVPMLESQDYLVRTVELPSVGAARADAVGLAKDAAVVRALVDEIGRPVLLCGHSYGGMVISQAASGSNQVVRLVYLCAFVPESGESLIAMGGGKLAPWIQDVGGGLTLPDLALAPQIFYSDCDAATQAWATGRLRPQCGQAYSDVVPHPGWKEIPSTYIVCSADNGVPPDWQRNVLAPRLDKSVELNASHSPFLSQPGALANLLAREAQS
jgi:pimeloyl-ACP methyl ester carboxylesterase